MSSGGNGAGPGTVGQSSAGPADPYGVLRWAFSAFFAWALWRAR